MNESRWSTIASLISIVLFLFHMTGDVMLGIEPGSSQNLVGATGIMLVWLCGTLLLAEKRLGYAIMLLGGILAVGVAYLHMGGAGVGRYFAKSDGAYWFVWTLFALGLSGSFSVILSLRGLWRLRSGRQA